MASTGVLPFIRGIDLSRYDFSGNLFPKPAGEMTGLRWLKLNRANLDRVPDELSNMRDIEHLQMVRNSLSNVHGELSDLPCLRSVIVRRNQIKTAGIPADVFNMKDLTIIDFSHNSLKDTPPNIDKAKGAIVLNLSHNNIEHIPQQMCSNLVDVLHVDLSHNRLQNVPPQIRRLTELQTLSLSHNPLESFQLKQLPSMTQLRVLHMANTERNEVTAVFNANNDGFTNNLSPMDRKLDNLPPILDNLVNLADVDFAANKLKRVPDFLFKLKNLRKLSLADNEITQIHSFMAEATYWESIETLNVSRNQLTALPGALTGWIKLRMLLANENKIDFNGIPAGIGKLIKLEVLHLAYNRLELIPEGVGRCVKLRKLKLNNNRLVTIPDGIHLLSDLAELDLRNNPDLVMPPKPSEKRKNLAFYNIDFSLEHQMKLSGQSPTSSISSSPGNRRPKLHKLATIDCVNEEDERALVLVNFASGSSKDPVARKLQFLKRRRGNADADDDQKKILQGMSEIAKDRTRAEESWLEEKSKKSKRWDETLEKPNVDYSDIFDKNVGQKEGISVWEIENFLPNPLEDAFHGHFYEGDCYIVLQTIRDDSGNLNWEIYYWIGEKTTLDKKACAAIHAVNLRNFLGATCRTIREEMNDESDEFIGLFNDELIYVDGERTNTGFFTVEQVQHPVRLYRIMEKGPQVHVEPVPLSIDSLDPRYVFLLDAGQVLYVWCGKKCKGVLRSKTRLFAEKLNKFERKGNSEIDQVAHGLEPEEFWQSLVQLAARPVDMPIVEHVPADFQPTRPKLFEVRLGMGYLEVPQVQVHELGGLKQKLLNTKSVYILDCFTDVFLWIGKKSTRLIRAAGSKLARELYHMIQRPEHAQLNRVTEGTESMIYKSKFIGWDDVIAVDFTRTADSVQRRGTDLKVIMEKDKMKTDLAALFLDRQQVMSDEEADQLLEECNEDLELMEPFVLEGRKFVRLPEKEFGTFYTCDCYVFLCRYWIPAEEDDEGAEEKEDEDDAKPGADDFQCVVYFWQGRDAGNMGWLTFTFSLQKKFEALFKNKLEVVRMHQQQENHKFLSHFKKRFVIRRGRRSIQFMSGQPEGGYCELFHVRANGSSICTRTIQVDCKAKVMMSAYCFIFRAPYRYTDEDDTIGRVYVWLGGKSRDSDQKVAIDVAETLLSRGDKMPMVVVKEAEEPDRFWELMPGGKTDYETHSEFMNFTRLFRCTNERGYFAVSEKTVDFCQDDLEDDDIMILDNGDQLYIWLGGRASEVEVKLAYKAAQVYLQHMRLKQPERPRKLLCTLKGKEAQRFKKCFHAWGKHKVPAGS